LEALRQPLEDGMVTISRSLGSFSFPSRFTLLASANPCPCGFYGHPKKSCSCTPKQLMQYRKKFSGPVMDRIDIFIEVPSVDIKELSQDNVTKKHSESSRSIQSRVVASRKIQQKRFEKDDIFTNAEMQNIHIDKYCHLSGESLLLLQKAAMKYNLSARSYFKIIKISRTIADLAQSPGIELPHIAEALQYKPRY